jgi:hypothetical protein
MPLDDKILQRLRDNDKAFTCLDVIGNQLREVDRKELLLLQLDNMSSFPSYNSSAKSDLNVYDIKVLVQVITQNRTLTWLSLLKTNIHSLGLKQLVRAIAHNSTLTFLDLSFNNIRDEGAKDLALVLTQNKTLTSLFLGKNNIGAQGAKQLSQALMINVTLTKLSLWKNEIGDEGARELAHAIAQNRTLTSLDIEKNKIGDEGLKELAIALMQNRNLAFINLEHNRITDIGAEELGKALVQNIYLRILRLGRNYLSHSGAELLVQILAGNFSLFSLTLDDEKNEEYFELYYLNLLKRRNILLFENLLATALNTLRLGRLLLYKATSTPRKISFFLQLPLEIKEKILTQASNTKKVLTKEQLRLIVNYAEGKIAPVADKLSFFKVTKCDRIRKQIKQDEVEAAEQRLAQLTV